MLQNFTSFFELMAALNGAFIVSDEFLKEFIERVTTTYSSLRKDLLSITSTLLESCDGQISELAKINPSSNVSVFYSDYNKLKSLYDSYEEDIAKKIKEHSSKAFNYMCLIGFLYCVSTLVVVGYNLDGKEYKGEWFTFNACLLAIMFIYLTKDKIYREDIQSLNYNNFKKIIRFYWIKKIIAKKTPKPSYMVCFSIAIIVLLGSTSFICTYHLYRNGLCEYVNEHLATSTSLLVPIAHFVYVVLKTSFVIRKHGNEMSTKIKLLNDKIRTLEVQISGAIASVPLTRPKKRPNSQAKNDSNLQ